MLVRGSSRPLIKTTTMILDYSKISNVSVDGIDTNDYPDFCDAYIEYAEYKGEPMTDVELETINEDSGYVYEAVLNQLH